MEIYLVAFGKIVGKLWNCGMIVISMIFGLVGNLYDVDDTCELCEGRIKTVKNAWNWKKKEIKYSNEK